MARPINPDDEIFWHQVRDAYDQVVTGTTEITVEVNDRKATISNDPDDEHMSDIQIRIWGINPKQRELNVV